MPVLVGRDLETSEISQVLARARQGRAAALVLVGAPGMGKTALLDWARDRATGLRCISLRGSPSDSELGYAGLLGIVRPLDRYLDRLTPRHASALRRVCLTAS